MKNLRNTVIIKSAPYTIIDDALYKQRWNGILSHCIFQSEVRIIFIGYHLHNCGGYFVGDSIAHKALMAGYW